MIKNVLFLGGENMLGPLFFGVVVGVLCAVTAVCLGAPLWGGFVIYSLSGMVTLVVLLVLKGSDVSLNPYEDSKAD